MSHQSTPSKLALVRLGRVDFMRQNYQRLFGSCAHYKSRAQRVLSCLCRLGWGGLCHGLGYATGQDTRQSCHVSSTLLLQVTKHLEWPSRRFLLNQNSARIAGLPRGGELGSFSLPRRRAR